MPSLADLIRMGKQYIGDAMPGGSLNPETAPVARQANYLSGILDPASQVSQDATNWHKRTQIGLKDQLAGRQTPEAEQAYQTMMMAAGMAPIGMTAWHASPHKFDKFSLDKIGIGQGAQAYGHGLYSAESPAVSGRGGSYDREFTAKALGKTDLNQQQEFILKHLDTGKNDMEILDAMAQHGIATDFDQAFSALNQMKSARSNIYKTDIPDEAVARFLDWDKPLSQQAPEVQKAIGVVPRDFAAEEAMFAKAQKMGVPPTSLPEYQKLVEQMDASKDLRHMSGAEWYKQTTGDMSGGAWKDPQDAASQYLRQQLGIPGIRYLDGGSRSAGQGSSNFVAFDPEMIRILERNGQATGLEPWKPGEYRLKDLIGKE